MELPMLLREVRQCRECEAELPLGPRPILAADERSKLLIVGQAPGIRVHNSGVAWNDASGERLREWLGISNDQFYDPALVAIVPMGFCYPGTGKSGDLPPRKECSRLWHQQLFDLLKNVKLTLLVGNYAQNYVLNDQKKKTLTETVKSWKEFTPTYLPLPHPSPRNNRWLAKNPWFSKEVLPYLRKRTRRLMAE